MTSDPESTSRTTIAAPRLGRLAASDERPAIVEPGRGSIAYRDVDSLADLVAGRLRALGVKPGSRIGIYMRRSADAIIAMLGALRAGVAYVPVDPRAPAERIADTHADCGVVVTLVEGRFEQAYRDALRQVGATDVDVQPIGSVGLGKAIEAWAKAGDVIAASDWTPESPDGLDPALILYTSGTTGRPKGWVMSRRAIEAHAAWCHRVLAPTREDVFANHAQFSFGMSLFDIYSSLGCGATLVLVPDEVRQHAAHVVDMIAAERVSIWFSGAAILSLIGQVPDLERRDLSHLRIVAFAGEVFPFLQLNALRRRVPHPRYFNFYGSTETNVAAYFELPPDAELEAPPPLGRPCEHYEARVVGHDGRLAAPGTIGELQLRGVGLTSGYWNQPRLTAEKMSAADDGGAPWYRSGDMVVQLDSGDVTYAGRIGRMVKLRGYRVEPGEIEARLYQHPSVREAGVVPTESASGLSLVAHLSTATGERVPIVGLKEFCAVKLPSYMIPERFEFHERLPRTSSGKIDLQALRAPMEAVAAR